MSEPEIQRAGADQISIGLPDVQNADRAIEQVGTTAKLQFYDWEPNLLGDRGPDAPFAGSKALYQAVELASKSKPKAERTDLAGQPEGTTPEQADRNNDTAKDRYYLFGPDQRLVTGPATTLPGAAGGLRVDPRPAARGGRRPEGHRMP